MGFFNVVIALLINTIQMLEHQYIKYINICSFQQFVQQTIYLNSFSIHIHIIYKIDRFACQYILGPNVCPGILSSLLGMV